MTGKEYKELEIRLWNAWADNDAEAWAEETPNFANLTKLQKERLDRVIESMIQNGGIERFEALTNTKEETETEEPKSGDVVEIDGNEYEVTAVENYGFFVKGRDYIIPFSDDYKIVGDAITEWTSRPKSGWTYLYTDDKNYNIDMDVYRTEDGKLVKVDGDWIFLV